MDDKNNSRIYRVPLIVGEAILPEHPDPKNFATWYINGKKRKVYLIPVSEEVFKAFINPDEAAKKKKQRIMQQAEEKGEQYALPLSLDSLIDDFNFDCADSEDVIEITTLTILVQEAIELVRKKKPVFADILELKLQNYSERDIGDKLNYCRCSIRNYHKQAIKMLKDLLQERY